MIAEESKQPRAESATQINTHQPTQVEPKSKQRPLPRVGESSLASQKGERVKKGSGQGVKKAKNAEANEKD